MGKLTRLLNRLTDIPTRSGKYQKLQERLNDIQDAIRSLAAGENIEAGLHIEKKRVGPYQVLLSGTPGGRGSASSDLHPWQVTVSTDEAGENFVVTLEPGTVNSWSVQIDSQSMHSRPSIELGPVDTDETYGIWLILTLNESGYPTETDIQALTSSPDQPWDAETGGVAADRLADVVVSDGVATVVPYRKESLFFRAGVQHLFWT